MFRPAVASAMGSAQLSPNAGPSRTALSCKEFARRRQLQILQTLHHQKPCSVNRTFVGPSLVTGMKSARKPTHRSSLWTARWGRLMRVFCMTEGCILCHSSLQDDDFSAPKAHEFDRCTQMHLVWQLTCVRNHCDTSTFSSASVLSGINYYKACHHLKCSDMSRTTTRSEVLGIDEFASLEEVKKAQMFCWKEKEDLCVCFFAGLQEALARVPSRQNLWPEHGTERGVP